jgi:peptide/nickel transport system ATP-binding protein
MNDTRLQVNGFSWKKDGKQIVRDCSFTLNAGETVALTGRSGSGKTITALALMGLQPDGTVEGKALFRTSAGGWIDLFSSGGRALHALRGKEIGMVFQEPSLCLNPAITCGKQLEEIIRIHGGFNRKNAAQETANWLDKVGLGEAGNFAERYPHQLSGGQKQRLMVAMALAPRPTLLIADEPTSSLDSENARNIMEILTRLCAETSATLLLITHDPDITEKYASRSITIGETSKAEKSHQPILQTAEKNTDSGSKNVPLLEAKNLCVSHTVPKGLFGTEKIRVWENLSFSLQQGETLGISGASGTGKSTLASVICGQLMPEKGELLLYGEPLYGTREKRHGKISLVFQDPFGSLNPKMRVGRQIKEVMPADGKETVSGWLERVGLSASDAQKYPDEFSGGQRQRIAIARALACKPDLLICDECVSALDYETKWEILRLLNSLRGERGISMLFISHDEEALHAICGRILHLT